MRRKMLRLMLPMLLVAASATGVLAPREVNAGGRVCDYYCVDPGATCCFTCYWMGGSCVCPQNCSIGPIEPDPNG